MTYTGCPIKSGTAGFQYHAIEKCRIFLHHQIKQFLQKRLMPRSLNLVESFWFYGHFLKHSHFQISLDFCDRWAKNYVGNGLSWGVLGKPIDPCQQKKNTVVQWDPPKHRLKGHSRHNSSLIGRKNQAKFENDGLLRNGHRIKITQPNSMILVSFSSVENVLFNDVKKTVTLLARRVLKIRRSAFYGTPGIWYTLD